MSQKLFRLLLSGLFLMGIGLLPAPARAAETFSPTVKIIAYKQYLNGSMGLVGTGSGTIINKSGLVLTNAHVVYDGNFEKPYDAFVICVSENSQESPDCRFTGTLKRYDERIDLALLDIDNKTAWGSRPSSFPYLNYAHGNDAEEGDEVTVRGFPANGGPTISTTKGQVSGFADVEGYKFLKTDADIDAGNSGGTMLDSEGNFVGVPSYLVSYYENSGRALKISEAEEWINSTRGEQGSLNISARDKIRGDWEMFHDTELSGKYTSDNDPQISLEIPDNWITLDASDIGLVISREDNQLARLALIVSTNLYKIDFTQEERLETLEKALDKDAYEEHEFIQIGDREALRFSDPGTDGDTYIISLQNGYKDIAISYYVPKNDKAAVESEIEEFLNSISFGSPNTDDPEPTTKLDNSDYPFTLEVPESWRVTTDDMLGSTLAFASRKTQKIEGLKIYYSAILGNEIDYTMEEGLEYDLDNYVSNDAEVLFESDELMMDGLPGWIYIYEYEDSDTDYTAASVTVVDPEYEFYFEFKAERSEFDDQLPYLVRALKTFKTKRFDDYNEDWDEIFDPANEGKTKIPYPGADDSGLNDIKGHRYEDSIKDLVKMDVIGGYSDGTFQPENPVNRAEALKIILQSLRAQQEEEGDDVFEMPENFNDFSDLKTTDWYATYVAEGVDKGIISGYPDGTFKGGNTVNLAEALKMTLVAHEANVWEGETDPWHKKYFDAAYALDLLPQDLSDPAKLLTRAELAYIVDQLVNQ